MNLKDFLSSRDGKNGEFYWSLVIERGWIQAGIWQIISEKAEVVTVSPPAAWETEDELVGAADAALSAAVQNFPEDVKEPAKTVFGVPSSWVSGGQIKKERLEEIRKVCAELSLEPSGFVVLPEAIAHFFKSQEGTPLNAIVLGVGAEEVELSVFKLGNLAGTSVIARSVSISDDVVEGLARFSSLENLPSRILLYDGKEGELEDIRQSLLDFSWDEGEKVKLLHTPKIEIIDPESKVLAVSLAGASEIGQVSSVGLAEDEREEPQEEKATPQVENVTAPQEELSPQELGFVVGRDVAEEKKPPEEVIAQGSEGQVPPSQAVKEPFFKKFVSTGAMAKIKLQAASLLAKFPVRPPRIGGGAFGGKKTWSLGGIILALVFIFGFVYWWFFPKATVTIYVAPKKLEEDVGLTIDTTVTKVDVEEKILPGEIIETEIEGDKTRSTTGTKKVGENAKGSVKIQNGTSSIINLAAGTVLVSSTDLKFSVDKAASISAALSPTNPGTATVDVTAADIGSEYNLAKDETFKVGNYPKAEVDGTALANFSGGSSRDISAVSADDQEALEEELRQELSEAAKDELAAKVAEEKYFIRGSVTSEVAARTFSHKVGDEADSFKLALTLTVKGVVVPKKEFYDLAREILKGSLAEGYSLRDEQIAVDLELGDFDESTFEMDGTISANLLPEISPDEIAKKVAGRYPRVAETYLATIPGFTRAEIKLKPNLPGRLGTLPRVAKNITITVSSER